MGMEPMHMLRTVNSLRALMFKIYFSRSLAGVKWIVIDVV